MEVILPGDRVTWQGRKKRDTHAYTAKGTVVKLAVLMSIGGVRAMCAGAAKIKVDPNSGYPHRRLRKFTTITLARLTKVHVHGI